MDLSREPGTLPTHTAFREPALSRAPCQAESGETISLQLLEFKTHLLEAIEELHIRRDADTRFEDQISKLVLEKQELEWEKESLQHQIETVANQHSESLTTAKKQFQAKLRNIEEERGKYQVIAELKDKEINNLKEELKSLQLLKYNLEKKSNELERKLALQIRSKDSHLNQLGEVEKRFSALSKQCAMVKQAHETLEQNVDEAKRINKKLTSANEKHQQTTLSLQKELDEVRNKLIKVKMTSVKSDITGNPTGRKQDIEQLQQKLNMETEINMKLIEENKAERAEKQEMVRSLQHTQQLLLSQTQTVRSVELELQTQRDTYQALKREHEVIQEKSKAMEEKVAQLTKRYAASKTSWDKEKTRFMECIRGNQEDFQAVKEAYDKLHLKHTELSVQAKTQAQHKQDLEKRDSSQRLCVSETQLFPTLVEDIQDEETLNEPSSSSEQPGRGSLQDAVSSQATNPGRLQDTGAVLKLVATGANGGMEPPAKPKLPSNTHMFTYPLVATTNPLSICNTSGTSDSNLLNNSDTADPSVTSDLNDNTIPASDVGFQISKVSSVSDTTAVSDTESRSVGGCVYFLAEEKHKEGNKKINEKGQEKKDDTKQEISNRKKEETNMEQQEVQGEDVMVGGSIAERRGTLTELTTDRHEGSEGSGKDAEEISQAETETKDRAEEEDTDRVKERAVAGLHTHTPDTQTNTDTATQRSHTLEVVDFMDAEPPLTVSEDTSHINEGDAVGRKGQTICVSDEPNVIIQEVQHLCHNEVQHFCEDTEVLNNKLGPVCQVLEENTQEKPCIQTTDDSPAEPPELLNQSSAMQTCDLPDGIVKELETIEKAGICNSDIMQTDKTHVTTKESSKHSGQLTSLVTNDDDSTALKGKECRSHVDLCDNITGQTPKESHLATRTDVTMNPVDLVSEGEACHAQMEIHKTVSKTLDTETEMKLPVHPMHDKDESSEANSSKCNQKPLLGEKLCNSDESFLPCKKTYRSLFEWGTAQRTTLRSRSKSDVSILHQGSSMSEQNKPGTAGFFGHPTSTTPAFLRNKQSKAPLVIMRASELFNASNVCGTSASSMRHQQGEWEVKEKTHTDSTTFSFPVFTSSSMASKLSLQTPQECSRFAASTAGPVSQSDGEPSCSQERDDQQSSIRAQISKIEQLFNTERLRMPKRRRTDD